MHANTQSSPLTILMRHGNKERGQGSDPVLTPKGQIQAIVSGQKGLPINTRNLRGYEFRVSPSKRTIETAILSVSQKTFNDAPVLVLDPGVFEVNEGPHCWGSEKTNLLDWLNGDLETRMHQAIDNAVANRVIRGSDPEDIKKRTTMLIQKMDQTAIVNAIREDWWPGGKNATETSYQAISRYQKVKANASPVALVAITHSTLIGDIMRLHPRFAFSAEPKLRHNTSFKRADVAEAGVFVLEDVRGGLEAVTKPMFNPNGDLHL